MSPISAGREAGRLDELGIAVAERGGDRGAASSRAWKCDIGVAGEVAGDRLRRC